MSPGDLAAAVAAAERTEAAAIADAAEACPADVRARLGLRTLRIPAAFALAVPAVEVRMYQRAFALGLDGPLDDRALHQLRRFFGAAGSPHAMLQWSVAGRPDDAPQRLERLGFRAHNRWLRFHHALDGPGPAPDPRVEPLRPEEASAFAELDCRVFGHPPALAPWTAALVGREGWSVFGARAGGRLVAVGALWVGGGAGWLGYAATEPAHRGQGLQTALIHARLAEARARGARGVVVETGDDAPERPNPSARNLRRAGFTELPPRHNWVRDGRWRGEGD